MEGSTRVIVGSILFFLFGLPLILAVAAPLIFGVTLMGGFGALLDFEKHRINGRLNENDIAFGGDAEQLRATAKRLRGLTASIADGRLSARSLAVAVVDVTDDRLVKPERGFSFGRRPLSRRTKPIAIDLGRAGDGAVLVVANRPVVWSAAQVQRNQRARIAIEGPSAFDVVDMPKGVLAGFRSGAFGAFDTTEPDDADGRAPLKRKVRFCRSVRVWARQFQVEPGDIRMWRITDPDQIEVAGDTLSQTGGTISRPEFVADFCRR